MIQRDIDIDRGYSFNLPENSVVKLPKSNNLINVIYPYRTPYGHWAYDDEFVTGEPFVMGSSEMIDSLVGDCDKFEAILSYKPLPVGNSAYISIQLDNIDEQMDEENNGMQGWYRLRGTNITHWLCGHLLDWFEGYPKTIFVNIKK